MIYVPQFSTSITRAECRKTKFSGLRQDPILENMEIWLMGNLVKEVSKAHLMQDRMAVQKAYAEAFNLAVDQVQLG